MRNTKKILSFTLIEVLVASTVIALLATGLYTSYSQINIQGRDSRRKADLEQIRAALEMYRNDKGYYPISSLINTSCGNTTGLSDGSTTYLSDVPDDPKCPNFKYYYTAIPSGCNNSSTFCSNYTLATKLESLTTTCQSLNNQCSGTTTTNCTYCLGPYGQK